MALNFIIQSLLAVAGSAFDDTALEQLGVVPARLIGHAAFEHAWLPALATLVTTMFVHGGWAHLLLNALFLIIIAPSIEPLLGSCRFTALYLVSGVIGGVLQAIAEPDSMHPIIGASGAISGIFGYYVMRFGERPQSRRNEFFANAIVALRLAVAWGGLQMLAAFSGLGIAVWAHIGGFLVGLAAACAPQLARRR